MKIEQNNGGSIRIRGREDWDPRGTTYRRTPKEITTQPLQNQTKGKDKDKHINQHQGSKKGGKGHLDKKRGKKGKEKKGKMMTGR